MNLKISVVALGAMLASSLALAAGPAQGWRGPRGPHAHQRGSHGPRTREGLDATYADAPSPDLRVGLLGLGRSR
jgi:hypothetical protein